jgi:hypothetical protein
MEPSTTKVKDSVALLQNKRSTYLSNPQILYIDLLLSFQIKLKSCFVSKVPYGLFNFRSKISPGLYATNTLTN